MTGDAPVPSFPFQPESSDPPLSHGGGQHPPRAAVRPRLRTLLMGVHLLILILPLAFIGMLRLYDNALLRQTEAELIAQGAVLVATYRQILLEEASAQAGRGAALQLIQLASTPLAPELLARLEPSSSLQPVTPQLDLTRSDILPRPPPPEISPAPPDVLAIRAGTRLEPIIEAAQKTTLAAIRVVDRLGRVVASSNEQRGLSLLGQEEVARALKGEAMSVLRQRVSDEPNPPVTSISRGTRVRIFVALPILEGGRVLGAVLLSRSPLPVNKALYANRDVLSAAAAALLLIVAVVSGLTAVVITRPLTALVEQARSLGRGTVEAPHPIAQPVTQEVQLLSEALVGMALALKERADYVQSLASHVSHAFKTPLTAMKGAIELLQEHGDEMERPDRHRFLSNLEGDVDRMEQLTRRLLELARADMSHPGGDACRVRPVLEGLKQQWQLQGLDLRIHGSPIALERCVACRAEVLDSVLTHLLENSFRHAGPQPVTLSVSQRDDQLQLVLQDEGPGIPVEDRDRIFDPFFTSAREEGGTGMGLPIARALVQGHRGSLNLAPSEAGACFRLELPLARDRG